MSLIGEEMSFCRLVFYNTKFDNLKFYFFFYIWEINKNCLVDSRPFQVELKLVCSLALVASGFR